MMKYLKNFESYLIKHNSKNDSVLLTPDDIFEYLGINMYDYESRKGLYDINTQKFIEEIFLGKDIEFTSFNRITGDKEIRCNVEKVALWQYKDLYIKILGEGSDWELIKPDSIIRIFDYDAEDKPLHKEIKIHQKTHKYNL